MALARPSAGPQVPLVCGGGASAVAGGASGMTGGASGTPATGGASGVPGGASGVPGGASGVPGGASGVTDPPSGGVIGLVMVVELVHAATAATMSPMRRSATRPPGGNGVPLRSNTAGAARRVPAQWHTGAHAPGPRPAHAPGGEPDR